MNIETPARVLTHTLATEADLPALEALMDRAIAELQRGFLTEAQIQSSRAGMGLDRQLIADRSYFMVWSEGQLAGCGGWSRRATLYGGSHSTGRNDALLDPATEPARVRAMYTHPDFTRRGVGRYILEQCEKAAKAEGFKRLELMGTMAGLPLYENFGFAVIERIEDSRGGAPVPLARMGKGIG